MDALDEVLISIFKTKYTVLSHSDLDAKLYKLGFSAGDIVRIIKIVMDRIQGDSNYFIEVIKVDQTRHKFRRK